MARIVGIGGILMKAKNPEKLQEWYRDHLGFSVQPWGGVEFLPSGDPKFIEREKTVWNLFPSDSKYFEPSTQPFMVNYRVDDLQALVAQLQSAGIEVHAEASESEFGAFAWVMDPEGNRVELWEPPKNGKS